ncbi:putative ribonuclease H-like domain-containing protein [Tanacetum coccineum]
MAPMALLGSKVNNEKSCSKTYLTNYVALKKQLDDLLVKLDDNGFKASTYKRAYHGCDKESDNSKENTDDSLKQQQKTDSKTSSVKSPLKVDKDWKEKFLCPANHVREEEPKKARKNNDAPIIEEWVSDDEDVVETTVVVKKKTVIPLMLKIGKNTSLKPVRYAEMYRSQRPRGNQRNWNGQKSNQLGSDFVMHNKACYICGSFDHLQYTCKHKRHVNDQKHVKPVLKNTRRVNDYYSTRMTHSNPRRNMIPQVVLMRSGIKAVNTAKPKDAYNVVKRNWFHDEIDVSKKTHDDSSLQNNGIADQQVNTARPKVNTGSREVSTTIPEVNTATPEDLVGPSPTSEDTQVEDQEIELGNIPPYYESSVQTRRMKNQKKRFFKLLESEWGEASREETSSVQTVKGFEDPNHPNKVYKVVKAVYGLHQAPRAWYDTLANYLLCNGFKRGKIDQTLFIKRHNGHILLVQIYVDDIIFGSTQKGLLSNRARKEFFLSQDKYCHEILRKFNYSDVKSASSPTDLEKAFASRPDIMFAVCACARFQVSPKSSHLLAVKRIFRYLKGKPSLGLWYSKDSPLELVAYTDSDYAGATQDRKSTTGGCQFLGNRLISWQCKKQTVVATSTTEAEYVAAASCCG